MVDFHSHVLPGIDDGSQSVDESVRMLKESARQGVTDICATPHFYADSADPDDFIFRRNSAVRYLFNSARDEFSDFPMIHLGAEVQYFSGMSTCNELKRLKIGNTDCVLVELPMTRWSDYIIDEIEDMGRNVSCIPVIAHIDRYIRVTEDTSYFERVKGRKILIQANASFFTDPEYRELAFSMLTDGRIHFIGSDCHGTTVRSPNMVKAYLAADSYGCSDIFKKVNLRARDLLYMKL